MNKLPVLIVAYLLLVLQLGLENLWSIPVGVEDRRVSPDLMLVLLVFVGMQASTTATLWTGLLLGLVSGLYRQPELLGPTALGYLVGTLVLLQMRNMVFREAAITNAICCLVAGLFAYLVEALLIGLRGVPLIPGDVPAGYSPTGAFLAGFIQLAYSAAVAIPITAVLLRLKALWGFPATQPRIAR